MKKKYLVEIEDITNSHVPIESLPKEAFSHCEVSNQFMIHMYDQMFSTIDRSYKNIWEMILAIGGGIGVLQLYKCRTLQPIFDVAVIGYIIGLFWILVRLIDANYWCNRNLFFIHKIEEKLLGENADDIFADFRSKTRDIENKYRTSIRYQIYFVVLTILLTVCSYLSFRFSSLRDLFTDWKFYLVVIIGASVAVPLICIYLIINKDFKENASLDSKK